MPTYATVKFIKDKLEGRVLTNGLVWKRLFSEGEVHRMHIRKASKFVKEGYAIYI